MDLDGAGTSGNVVAGNRIGTDVTGTRALGNAGRGVSVFGGAQANRIGADRRAAGSSNAGRRKGPTKKPSKARNLDR